MKIVTISDIHIHGADDPLYRALLTMMQTDLHSGDQFVLAGDIFDFLVGDQSTLNRRYSEFFELVRELGRRGVHTTYIEGNHDFHLRGIFRDVPNVRVVPAEIEIKTRDHRVYIAHGDLVDRGDRGYLALRALFRSPITKFAAFALPARTVEWIGNQFSASSRQRNPRLPEERGGDRLTELRKIYRGFARDKFEAGYRAIILGHCHDLDGAEFRAEFRAEVRIGQYLNVGFPRKHHQYVVFTDESGLTRKFLPGFQS